VGYPRIGGAAQDVRITPGFGSSDPGTRPSAAQSWPELSIAACPGQRTLEAARGNGYAPVRGTPVMMMMTNTTASADIANHTAHQTGRK